MANARNTVQASAWGDPTGTLGRELQSRVIFSLWSVMLPNLLALRQMRATELSSLGPAYPYLGDGHFGLHAIFGCSVSQTICTQGVQKKPEPMFIMLFFLGGGGGWIG